jgi:hypothetical protein
MNTTKFVTAAVLLPLILCLLSTPGTANSASDWVDKSLVLYNQGRYDEVIQACDKAIELE